MQKSLVRKRLIEERQALSSDEVASKSDIIGRRIIDSAFFRDAVDVALYSAFRGEVQTDLIFDTALSMGKRVLMPKLKREDYSIAFIPVSTRAELEVCAEGFLEPRTGVDKGVDVSGIDLFIIPGVAYDARGVRLGMGKGCYDRALQDVKREIVIAPAYEFQLLEEVPSYHHDLAVGWIATEDRLIKTAD